MGIKRRAIYVFGVVMFLFQMFFLMSTCKADTNQFIQNATVMTDGRAIFVNGTPYYLHNVVIVDQQGFRSWFNFTFRSNTNNVRIINKKDYGTSYSSSSIIIVNGTNINDMVLRRNLGTSR